MLLFLYLTLCITLLSDGSLKTPELIAFYAYSTMTTARFDSKIENLIFKSA